MNILNINTRNRKALGALTLPNETEAPDVCLLYSAHSQRCFRAHSSGTLGHLYSRAYKIRNGLVRGINKNTAPAHGAVRMPSLSPFAIFSLLGVFPSTSIQRTTARRLERLLVRITHVRLAPATAQRSAGVVHPIVNHSVRDS